MISRLRTWWQVRTGEEETPFDGDTPAWLVSMLFHIAVLVAVALVPVFGAKQMAELTLSAPVQEEVIEEEILTPEEFFHSPQITDAIGANSDNGVSMAFSEAPVVSEVSVDATPEMTKTDFGTIEVNNEYITPTGLNYNANHAVKGSAGVGETGAKGAIDRITHEILMSLEERKTLVVWLFDQSASLRRQRETILNRFDRIYEELGVIEAAGNPAFSRHENKPLLTSVFAFGQNITMRTKQPTDDLAAIKDAVDAIEMDESGIERTFAAVQTAAEKYKAFRTIDPETNEPVRNVMIIVITDEVGDDMQMLEETIKSCRRSAIPVYVLGVPAAFGRKTAMLKWVDPDPKYSQEPQWGEVTQGPESLMPERLNLRFADKWDPDPMDSGFGPFALTRLSYETGGIYFAIHPNRHVGKEVNRNETAEFSAHFKYFFDPQVMRKYRPDYVSIDEYKRRLMENKCRASLVQAATMSWVGQMEDPQRRFVKRDEAALANALSAAQQSAAKLEPKVNALVEMLKLGEVDREREDIPRWQAGYDLAMGRALAAKARTEAYNVMLAAAKRGFKFTGKNNTLELVGTNEFGELGSALGKTAEKAEMYLKRVVDNHPNTPWAMLAKHELETPLAWKWKESFTDLAPRREGMGNNNPPVGRDDMLKMLEKRAPVRPPPKL